MVSELIGNVDHIELWGDPDLLNLSGYMNANGRNVFLTVELKTHYFIDPIKFTMKRDTRADFNYNHISFSDYVQGVITETIDGVERHTGIIALNASIDAGTTKIEVVVDPDNIVQYKEPDPVDPDPEDPDPVDPDPEDPDPVDPDPEDPDPVDPDPEPDWQTLEVPVYSDHASDFHRYLNMMLKGLITLTVNGEIVNVVSDTIEDITVDKNKPLVVEIINNQLEYVFNLDDIEFEFSKMNLETGEREVINAYPNIATPDLLQWEVTGENWDLYIDITNTMDFLPILRTTVRPDQPETVDLPFSRYYKVSEEALQEIDKFRFSDLNPDIDYTQYITSLRRYPFNLEAGEDTQILIGDHLLDTTGEHINEFTYRLDLGTIMIPQTVSGDVGFKNVTVELFTPYHNKITLDTDEVLNERISLSMIINLTNGDSTLNVKNERNNTIIHSVNSQLGLDIPYSFSEQVNITKSDSILFNEINQCYVEIKSLIPSNSVTSNAIQVTVIDRYTGFIKTDLSKMISNATQLEKQEIQRLLSGGVYLNGQFEM